MGQLRAYLDDAEKRIKALTVSLGELDCEQIRSALDPVLQDGVYPFVEGRELLRSEVGGKRYVAIMSPFASAERRLNRAWSAAVDGYVDEAREQVKQSTPFLEETLSALG